MRHLIIETDQQLPPRLNDEILRSPLNPFHKSYFLSSSERKDWSKFSFVFIFLLNLMFLNKRNWFVEENRFLARSSVSIRFLRMKLEWRLFVFFSGRSLFFSFNEKRRKRKRRETSWQVLRIKLSFSFWQIIDGLLIILREKMMQEQHITRPRGTRRKFHQDDSVSDRVRVIVDLFLLHCRSVFLFTKKKNVRLSVNKEILFSICPLI